MKPEKTVKMILTQKDIQEIRNTARVCVNQGCGDVFFTDDTDQRVCDDCVNEAMEAEGFYVT